MKTIPLTKGYEAIVDDEDYETVAGYKWYASINVFPNGKKYVYAKHMLPVINGKRREERMHQLLMEVPHGLHVDHINGDTLDNRKSNMRIVTNRQNNMNRHQTKSSKYPGVTWAKREQRWIAQAQIGGKHIHIGSFRSEEDAHAAYMARVSPLEKALFESPKNTQCQPHEAVVEIENYVHHK